MYRIISKPITKVTTDLKPPCSCRHFLPHFPLVLESSSWCILRNQIIDSPGFAHKKTAVIHLGFSFCFSRRCNLLVKNEKFPNIFTQIDGTQDQIIGLTLLMSTLLNRSIGELTLQSQCSVLLFKELLESFGTWI